MKAELSESEYLIMEYLWKCPQGGAFNDIQDYLCKECGKDWKKQTINTFLSRMVDKGLVERNKNGKNCTYVSICDKESYKQLEARQYLNRYYDGSVGAFMSALTGGAGLNDEEYSELMNILRGE